jgi:drug/metabolite transporter (DMT)-like permease
MLEGRKGHLAILMGCVLYGTTGIFLAHIHEMSIPSMIFYRLFFGALLILLIILATGNISQIRLRKKKKLLALQGILTVVNMFFYFYCVKTTCFSIAILLEYTSPVYVMIASPFILKEKISRESIYSMVLAIAGVILVIRPESGFSGFKTDPVYLTGILAGMISGMLAASLIMNIRLMKDEYPEMGIAFWSMGLSCLLMSPFAFGTPWNIFTENLSVLASFGAVSVGMGAFLTIIGFSQVEAQTGSLLSLIEPVSGVLFDVTLLGVQLGTNVFIGCILVLISALLVSARNPTSKEM